MKFTVVGGGISGCITAVHLLQMGHEVEIHEVSDKLGGILRDIRVGTDIYLRNTQYFDIGTPLMNMLSRIDKFQFTEFDHYYGSWNDLFSTTPMIHHDFAQIAVPGKMGEVKVPLEEPVSVKDRLSLYEKRVSEPLQSWASKFWDLKDLDVENSLPLQLGRVFYPEDVERVIGAKKDSCWADNLLGIPRSSFSPPAEVIKSALPLDGYDKFFKSMEQVIEKNGGTISFNSPVSVKKRSESVDFTVRRKLLESDYFVWCSNPTPLILNLGGMKLDSPETKSFNMVGRVEGDFPPSPVYFHVFSNTNPITRIFCYNIDGNKVTVEGIGQDHELNFLKEQTKQVLFDLGWDFDFSSACLETESRYSLVTCDDKSRINKFSDIATANNVITGGWEHFSRDSRLDSIFSQIQDVIAT